MAEWVCCYSNLCPLAVPFNYVPSAPLGPLPENRAARVPVSQAEERSELDTGWQAVGYQPGSRKDGHVVNQIAY
jgi:hypothetical protein